MATHFEQGFQPVNLEPHLNITLSQEELDGFKNGNFQITKESLESLIYSEAVSTFQRKGISFSKDDLATLKKDLNAAIQVAQESGKSQSQTYFDILGKIGNEGDKAVLLQFQEQEKATVARSKGSRVLDSIRNSLASKVMGQLTALGILSGISNGNSIKNTMSLAKEVAALELISSAHAETITPEMSKNMSSQKENIINQIPSHFFDGKVKVLPIGGNAFELFVEGENQVLTITESGLKKLKAGQSLAEEDVLHFNENSFNVERALRQAADGADIKILPDPHLSAVATGYNAATSAMGAFLTEAGAGNLVRGINEYNPINMAIRGLMSLFDSNKLADLQSKIEGAETTEDANNVLKELPASVQEAYKQHGKIIFELADATNEKDLKKVVQISQKLIEKAGEKSQTAQALLSAVNQTLLAQGVGSLEIKVRQVGKEIQWTVAAQAAQKNADGTISSTSVGFSTIETDNQGDKQRFVGGEISSGVEKNGLRVSQNIRGGVLEEGATTQSGNTQTIRHSAVMGEATVGADYTFQNGVSLGGETGANIISAANGEWVTWVYGARMGYSTKVDNSVLKNANASVSYFKGPEGATPALNVGGNLNVGTANNLPVGVTLSPNDIISGANIGLLKALDVGTDSQESMQRKAVAMEVYRLADLLEKDELSAVAKLQAHFDANENMPKNLYQALKNFLEIQKSGIDITDPVRVLKAEALRASSEESGFLLKYSGTITQKYNPAPIGSLDLRAAKVAKHMAEKGTEITELSATAETPTNLALPNIPNFGVTKNTTAQKSVVISGTTGLTTAQVLSKLTLVTVINNNAFTNNPTDKTTWTIVDNGNGTMTIQIPFTAAAAVTPANSYSLTADNAVNADVVKTFTGEPTNF